MLKRIRPLLVLWEKVIVKVNRWEYIPGSVVKLLYAVPHRYQGAKLRLADDTVIEQGDIVVEIHIDNLKMKGIESKPELILSLFQQELQALALAIDCEDKFKESKAIHGTTVLYSLAAKKGFTIIQLEAGVKKRLLKIWGNLYRTVFHQKRVKFNKHYRNPRMCWLSKSQLLKYS